ncbi:putative type VI secretion system effector [Acinetobacter bereziniae]|uniref:putative type VI secretion system effector n=1 Tax=Acinetobacter bereziniae TaxID=106648 RepID=UPI0032154F15
MIEILVIEGVIKNLKVEDSKIHPLKNLDKDALGASMLGALTASSSLATNAPIMLMAAQGETAKTFIAEINGYPIIGQFTTVKFKEDTPLVAVISTEKEKGRYLVYSILDPQSGLLYMMYEMGRSIKSAYLNLFKWSVFWSIFTFIVIFSIFILANIFSENLSSLISTENIKYLFLIFGFSSFIIFLFFFSFIFGSRSVRVHGSISEKVFNELKFENTKNQNFYNQSLLDQDGMHLSVMEYRKSLKGKDPYPEDYFKKKNNQNDGD